MKDVWKGKKISGILTILPENEYSFEDTILAESMNRVRRLKKIMGFDKRRRQIHRIFINSVFLI